MTVISGPRATPADDRRDPLSRLLALFDQGSLLIKAGSDDSGVVSAQGEIDRAPVRAYCFDARLMGGAMGSDGCRQVVETIDGAVSDRVPVIGLWHSGGARLGEGVIALDAVGRVFAAIVRASGRVPQVSVVFGPAAGGAAYGPALTDIVVMSAGGRMFVTGPDVVRNVTGEQVDMRELGGPDAHGRRSGVAHVTATDDSAAIGVVRGLAGLLGRQGKFAPEGVAESDGLSGLLPEHARQAYDVRPLVTGLLDGPGIELQARWAPSIVTVLGRLAGRTVGVIANNPLRLAGCLNSVSAEKGARFVRMCDALGVPLVTLVDVPGYLPGVRQEWEGIVRRGAKLLHAFAEATVPRVTLVTRKAYGGAYIAMNSRALGATAVFAWPSAEISVMGAVAAVQILHRRALAAAPAEKRAELLADLAREHDRAADGLRQALATGAVDEIITPAQTRRRIAYALAMAPGRRGAHGNIPL